MSGRYATCPNCHHRLRRVKDMWGRWDGETYECIYCGRDYDDVDEDGEGLSVEDAALIWLSNGQDEDYMFGYSEEELKDAL